jgi:hypothetical protein
MARDGRRFISVYDLKAQQPQKRATLLFEQGIYVFDEMATSPGHDYSH